MEKHKHPKIMGFLNISREAEVYAIPKTWEKWNSMCFLNISHEAETYEFPETWDKWILMLRENYEKTQAFQSYGFLTYFTRSGNPYNCQTMGWVNSYITEQVWENTDNFQGSL